MENLSFEHTTIKDGFWKFYYDLNKNKVALSIYDRFKETGRFDAFRCDWKDGMPNRPDIFWDSDIAKWIEGVSYILKKESVPELEKIVDEVVENISKNQRADGYFNLYYLAVEPSKIYTNRGAHELYCTGHLIEGAIAYHKATGKDKFLNCMLKNIDYIYRVFVEEKSARFTTPGHEEIELALLKLYKYLGNEKHLELARFFINQRGNNQLDENVGGWNAAYNQSDLPVREISEAVGHSVRACYLYTAMAMLAKIDGDKTLKDACDRVFYNIINKKMSITGGIGADYKSESFSYEYNIPNSDTYNETCAAISLAMFASAMQEIEADSKHGDIIERVYYNGFISGISLSGDKFFYPNPLEIDQKKYAHCTHQPSSERVKVFACSCCPPNVLRMLATVADRAYTVDGNTIYCNQFINGETRIGINNKEAIINLETQYPLDGKMKFTYRGESVKLFVRIPSWCVEYSGKTEKGYAVFKLDDGDELVLDLPMKVHFMEANPYVQDDSGRYAVMRGPIVYCMEGIDNGENLRDITLLENGDIKVTTEDGIPAPVLYIEAQRRKTIEALYSIKTSERISFTARLIPYFSFANRGATDMLVWTMVK